MLFTNTVAERTLELLKGIMTIPELEPYYLTGGTALALQLGHRVSVDLDFFGKAEADLSNIPVLLKEFGNVTLMSQSKSVLVLNINTIKVDFVNYKYPLLFNVLTEDNIRLSDIRDISAMKLAALAGRGRKRDFYDLYFLLKKFSLNEMLEFYNNKFPDGSLMQVLRSITYFEDAENDPEPVTFIHAPWENVKEEILEEIRAQRL